MSMTKVISIDEAIDSLRQVVAQRGEDYVYRGAYREWSRRDRRAEADKIDFSDPNARLRYGILPSATDEKAREQFINQRAITSVRCFYAKSTDPAAVDPGVNDPEGAVGSCGVGRAIEIIAPDLFDAIAEREAAGGSFPAIEISTYTEHEFQGGQLTQNAARVYQVFQASQDAGDTYGMALECAEAEYRTWGASN